jgi:hypothetical protein
MTTSDVDERKHYRLARLTKELTEPKPRPKAEVIPIDRPHDAGYRGGPWSDLCFGPNDCKGGRT